MTNYQAARNRVCPSASSRRAVCRQSVWLAIWGARWAESCCQRQAARIERLPAAGKAEEVQTLFGRSTADAPPIAPFRRTALKQWLCRTLLKRLPPLSARSDGLKWAGESTPRHISINFEVDRFEVTHTSSPGFTVQAWMVPLARCNLFERFDKETSELELKLLTCERL